MFKIINPYSYYILAFLLLVLETIHISKGAWGGDFWEHSAVVNELSKNILHPTHPMFDIKAPHEFFSPYSLLVAFFSKITGLHSVNSLKVFAFVNLTLFLSFFYYFCRILFKSNYQLIASLSLVFILLFWGSSPFLWSGFYHLFVLNYVLPYPSTFSISLSFLTLGLLLKNKAELNSKILLIGVLIACVFLSHPYTGIFLIVCSSALVFTFYKNTFIEKSKFMILLLSSFILLSFLWPYYSFIKLFANENMEFHVISKPLYNRILGINWPILVALPVFFILKRNNVLNFLALSILVMILIYTLGYISQSYGVSRILSGIMIFCQITLSYMVVTSLKDKVHLPTLVYTAIIFILFAVSLYKNSGYLKESFLVKKKEDLNYYKRYEFLRLVVLQNRLILSDEMSNWYIPSFGGKVISSVHPLLFVKDNKERRSAVNAFFNEKTYRELRKHILQKYHPDYLLIDLSLNTFSETTLDWMNSQGQTVYNKNNIRLIKLMSTEFK